MQKEINLLNYSGKMQKLLDISKNNESLKFDKSKKVLLLNDTYDDFHHGSCATSYVIREKLKNKYNELNVYGIEKLRFVKIDIYDVLDFDNKKVLEKFENNNKELLEFIKNTDIIVVNGEGCISHNNEFTKILLYIMYISKVFYHKEVHLINTSIYLENEVDLTNINASEELKKILVKVLDVLNSVKVRDYISFETVKENINDNVILAFDNIPLYIKKYYKNVYPIKGNYILLSGGNNIKNIDFDKYIEFIDKIKKIYSDCKMIFLISNVKTAKCKDDIELFNKLKKVFENEIILYEANTIDEFISCIDNAKILVSGRFHHTIVALNCKTSFFVFNTNTPKIKSILEMFDQEKFLITKDNIDDYIKNIDTKIFGSFDTSDIMIETMNELAEKNY